MTWTYEIITGRIYSDSGSLVGVGYSGAPGFKNNPADVMLKNEGPIPPGTYTIGAPQDTVDHGPYAMALTPDPANVMYGRDEFLMHGDNVHQPGTASEGCIIQARDVREDVWNSMDHVLNVVTQLEEI